MLTKEPSFASLLVKQSPAMHCGHGWIMGKDGKRWHPCRSQDVLLTELSTTKKEKSWRKLQKVCFTSSSTRAKSIQFMRMSLQVVIRLFRVMVVSISRCEMGHSFGEKGFRK
ncbi:TPA: DUF2724 domain-containing protein [Citrobacter freundii]|nr:DUF2724 domain-containing protein [Citrobacter freundii]HCL6723587.1 DUF2724 domain-containing protein [Citrobacter freundii]